jgi:hypothetical protein
LNVEESEPVGVEPRTLLLLLEDWSLAPDVYAERRDQMRPTHFTINASPIDQHAGAHFERTAAPCVWSTPTTARAQALRIERHEPVVGRNRWPTERPNLVPARDSRSRRAQEPGNRIDLVNDGGVGARGSRSAITSANAGPC